MSCLLVTVGFLDGRFHGLESDGRPEWPPSPARLFQALVAGAARGAVLATEDQAALTWLEQLDPPLVAVPPRHKGQAFSHFLPNNDLDTKGGDPARIGEIRSATKRFHPQIFNREMPFFYLWSFGQGAEQAERIMEIAQRLYQLGRGVDMAWAVAEVLPEEEAAERLAAYPGAIHRPSLRGGGRGLACPQNGSLGSLVDRHEKARVRFRPVIEAAPTKRDPNRKKLAGQTFAQPPKPRFHRVHYDTPPVRLLFELRDLSKGVDFLVWPLGGVVRLVEIVRNKAAERLSQSLNPVFPDQAARVERVFGLCRDTTETDKARRIRIIPLPSIGHPHADHGIRRLLVEIPPDCPIAAADIEWAFSATEHDSGGAHWMMVRADRGNMLRHYGVDDSNNGDRDSGFRIWRTVTPMALPTGRPKRRTNGSERAAMERDTALAVGQALRHAAISSKPLSIRVQQEPFEGKGLLAGAFAGGSRFPADRLHHVEIVFTDPVAGPIIIGNGRYLGLGLMRRVQGKDIGPTVERVLF